jgi:hypothetical protein
MCCVMSLFEKCKLDLLFLHNLSTIIYLFSEHPSKVKFVRWSLPTMMQKFKLITHASISK